MLSSARVATSTFIAAFGVLWWLLDSSAIHHSGFAHALTFGSSSSSPSSSVQSSTASTTTATSTSRSSSSLFARKLPRFPHDEFSKGGDTERLVEVHRPVETLLERPGLSTPLGKPKIVVLGATGRIGRLVVEKLLSQTTEMTVVAVVRNIRKANRVLFDEADLFVERSSSKRGKPTLELVEANLVPPQEVYGYVDEDDAIEIEHAKSASKYFGNSMEEYDFRDEAPDPNEALEECIRDCTCVISCLGTDRTTNAWTDFLAMPIWRLLKRDASSWCKDAHHPYYVNYATTRKVVGMAEREQRRRNAIHSTEQEALEQELVERGQVLDETTKLPKPDRIRVIRISDNYVAHNPWSFVPLVVNIFKSMVFQYQEMSEILLEQSSLVDTVVLRPADLTDLERDVNSTMLLVDATSGAVPTPANISREDVAELAVVAAITNLKNVDDGPDKNEKRNAQTNGNKPKPNKFWRRQPQKDEPVHYTIGVSWAHHANDGLPNAQACMAKVIKEQKETEKKRRKREVTLYRYNVIQRAFIRWSDQLRRRRKTKPYGICAAVIVYLWLGFAIYLAAPSVPNLLFTQPKKLLGYIAADRGKSLFQQIKFSWPKGPAPPKYISF